MKKETTSQIYKRILASRLEPIINVGDQFQDCDKRYYRIIEVVKIKGNKIHIKTIANGVTTEHHTLFTSHGRVTVARRDRFFKYSNGYRILGGRCHECQVKRGGEIPRGGHLGITVSMGTCHDCLDRRSTLVPSCDYNWPKEGRKAVWD